MALLETRALSVAFGGLKAVDGVSLTVEKGLIVGLIGPNGAGKTTFVDAVTGFVPAAGGIVLDGLELAGLSAYKRARAGLARTWQSLDLFGDLDVFENLRVAAERQSWRSFLSDLVRPSRRRDVSAVEHALSALDLEDVAFKMPDELSNGQRRLVGLARALAARPKLICLDEPAAGLDPAERAAIGQRLRAIREGGTTILLIDHDMRLVLGVCDRVYVMNFGQLIAAGAPDDVRRDEHVISAYLGQRARRGAESAGGDEAPAEEARRR